MIKVIKMITLLSLVSAAIRSGHSIEYSKFFKHLSMLATYVLYTLLSYPTGSYDDDDPKLYQDVRIEDAEVIDDGSGVVVGDGFVGFCDGMGRSAFSFVGFSGWKSMRIELESGVSSVDASWASSSGGRGDGVGVGGFSGGGGSSGVFIIARGFFFTSVF